MENTELQHYSGYRMADIIEHLTWIWHEKPQNDYGTGAVFTSKEVHTVSHIADCPGITATELALSMNKTKGAISQMLKKLEQKGLIRRETDPQNNNRIQLYPTAEGLRLDAAHREFDSRAMEKWLPVLRTTCTQAEIDFALNVISRWLAAERGALQHSDDTDAR